MSKPNAYSMFVNEIARKRGGNVNKAALFRELDQTWRTLPDSEKQRYKDRAKNAGDYQKTYRDQFDKASCNPAPQDSNLQIKSEPASDIKEKKPDLDVKTLVKRPREDDEQEKKLIPGIPNWKKVKHNQNATVLKYLDQHLFDIRQVCHRIIRDRGQRVLTTPIYSFSANVLCKLKSEPKIFIPLEISIYAYSLKDGRNANPYHVLIDPGEIPSGHINLSNDHAENHKITIPPRASYPEDARKDYKKIYKELLDYTNNGERTILVPDYREMLKATGCIEWLHRKASEVIGTKLPKCSTWTILPVTEYVTCLYNSVYVDLLKFPMPKFGLHYYVNMKLEASTYDYNSAIMCKYHQEDEKQTKWCAKSCAMRMFTNIEEVLEEIYNMYQAVI